MLLIIGKFNCRYKNCYITYPVLFRILYCCGLRISEALDLKLKNVDLENGILYVFEAKNNIDRLIPISEKLRNICIEYYQKMHINSNSEDYFFFIRSKEYRIQKSTICQSFHQILDVANIERNIDDGPKIHSFRHTFAVRCLKKFVNENKDLNAYLPILKTYMGHSKFRSTEYYLKLTNDLFPDITQQFHSYIGNAIPNVGGDINAK